MEEHINTVINWLKQQKVKGCITGSTILGYFEGQDIDLFLYTKEDFIKIFYALYHNPMFHILDKAELWKAESFMDEGIPYKVKIQTIKFMYNTCIPINIIWKENADNIYKVLSTFDMDIIAKGYDIQTKQTLDLSEDSQKTKVASWNKWNTAYYNPKIWQVSRILRQLERIIKYHKRGYNTDNVTLKYIELIDNISKIQNVFKSSKFETVLTQTKKNTKTIKQILEIWLKTHKISDKSLELLKLKIKEL